MSIWDDFKAQFRQSNNFLIQIILVNVVVFITLNLLWLFGGEGTLSFVLRQLGVPANLGTLIFKPWTLLTSMFTQFQFWHILGNMLALYWFGRIVCDFLGAERFFSLYIMGGLAGNVVFLAAFNLVPALAASTSAFAIGASGAVFGIATGAATLAPDYRFNLILFGPVKIVYIVAIYIFLSFIGLRGNNVGGELAHLAGALFGFIYVKQLRAGNDLGKPVVVVFNWIKNLGKPKPKIRVSHRSSSSSTSESKKSRKGGSSETSSSGSHQVSQEEIDRILDKISQSGYESLSKDEKAKLFSASQKNKP